MFFSQAPYYLFCLLWCLMLVKLASRAADQVFVSVYDAIVMYAGWRGPKCIFAKIHSIMSLCRQICIFHANYRWPEQLQGGFWCLWKSPTNTHFSLATRKSPTCLLACLPWALAIDFISTASNQSGNTHFPLATSCWQMVANPSMHLPLYACVTGAL